MHDVIRFRLKAEFENSNRAEYYFLGIADKKLFENANKWLFSVEIPSLTLYIGMCTP